MRERKATTGCARLLTAIVGAWVAGGIALVYVLAAQPH